MGLAIYIILGVVSLWHSPLALGLWIAAHVYLAHGTYQKIKAYRGECGKAEPE